MPKRKQSPPASSAEKLWPPLPKVHLKDAVAIEEFLLTSYKMKRPPEVAAKLLALIIELWQREQPFPQREHVAHSLGCTKWGVDNALSVALARELITTEVGTEISTRMTHRDGVIRHRYYIPCDALVKATGKAHRAA